MTKPGTDRRDSRWLNARELAFFGRVMAGQSHEVTNVLNIIHELAGLQSDLLGSAEHGRPLDVDRLRQTAERIRHQVRRGETIVRAMNRFAHSVDCPVTVFDVREAIGEIAQLSERSAHLARAVLECKLSDESVPLETSPFGFKHAVFLCIEMALAAADRQRRVAIDYRISEPGVTITITSADPMVRGAESDETLGLLKSLLDCLGGQLVHAPAGEDPHRVVIFFPRPESVNPASDTPRA